MAQLQSPAAQALIARMRSEHLAATQKLGDALALKVGKEAAKAAPLPPTSSPGLGEAHTCKAAVDSAL